jgi:hypothetical protein
VRFDLGPGAVHGAGSQTASGYCRRGRSYKGLSRYQYDEEVAYYARGGKTASSAALMLAASPVTNRL